MLLKIHVWLKIANITHALPVPVYWQTDFTPKRVVVSCLHDTAARFRTGVKFSPRYKNRGELTPGDSRQHDILWWYHVRKYRAMRGNRSELAPGRKSPRCHVNTPLLWHEVAGIKCRHRTAVFITSAAILVQMPFMFMLVSRVKSGL